MLEKIRNKLTGNKKFKFTNERNITMKKIHKVLLSTGLVLALSVFVGAVTIPNTFTDGTPISASQMNQNFNAIENDLNNNVVKVSPFINKAIFAEGAVVSNKNNTNASVSLGWLNDLARIRVGGSGPGAENGLDIQGIGDRSLLKIGGNGGITTEGWATVRNPDNLNAGISLSWLNNIPRIRVGGNGTGNHNGLDIQVTGDRSLMRLLDNGNVGIGITNPQAKLDVNGTTRTKVLQITGGSDLAEPFEIISTSEPEPGMVVSINPNEPGKLSIASEPYDRKVAGIISGAGGVNPGVVITQEGSELDGGHPVALTGRVYAWVDASYGAIEPGDLLTSSETPGHAMKVSDYDKAQGTILGKAMTSLEDGQGLVLVLIRN